VAPGNGQSPEAAAAQAIVSDAVQVFLAELQRYYDMTQDSDNEWDPEDVVDQLSQTTMEVLPVVRRSVDFALELLRPWSAAFNKRGVDNA
jgi:hypothetical protein